MKTALLGLNDDSLPRVRLIPVNTGNITPNHFVIEGKIVGNLRNSMDASFNNSTFTVSEWTSQSHFIRSIVWVYNRIDNSNKLILKCRKGFYYSPVNSLSSAINASHDFVIFAVEHKNRRSISLTLCQLVDDFNPAMDRTGRDLGTIFELEEEHCYLKDFDIKLSTDEKTLSLMVETFNEENEEHKRDVHIFRSLFSSDNCLSLKRVLTIDAMSMGVCQNDVVFNINADKILMFLVDGVVVYSLHTQSVIAKHYIKEMYLPFEWAHDLKHGEILIHFAEERTKINVHTINYLEKTLSLITKVNVSDFIPKHLSFDFRCQQPYHRVTSGTSLLILARRDVYLIDPFTGHLLQKIICDVSRPNISVINVQLNWCSNEVVVFYSGVDNKFFGQVFKLKTRFVEPLLHSALKVVLLNYSINDLVQLNLPKSIKDNFFK